VLFAWFPSIPIPALANDVLGSVPVCADAVCLAAVYRVPVPPSKAAKSAVEGPSGTDVCFAVKRGCCPTTCLCDAAAKLL